MSSRNAIKSYFEFNGIRSSDYGVYVTPTDIFTTAVRDYEQISVPGRNGDVFKDNTGYKNVNVTYHCNIAASRWLGFDDKYYEFARLLTASTGYCELRDSYRPNIVRQAVLATEIKPSAKGAGWTIGEFDITFSAKPQLWLADESMDYDVTPVTLVTDSSGNVSCKTDYIPVAGAPITLELVTTGNQTVDAFTVSTVEYDEEKTYMQTATDTLSSSSKTASVSAGEGVRYLVIKWPQNALDLGAYIRVISRGSDAIRLCASGNAITNDTPYEVRPTITLARTSAPMTQNIELMLNDYIFVVKPFSGSIVIDCEAMTIANSAGKSRDSYVGIYDSNRDMAYDFPTLEPGVNILSLLAIEDSEGSGPAVTINLSGMAVTY